MTQQDKKEKTRTFYQAKQKADNDLILFYHFQTVKDHWKKSIKERE